MKWILLLIIVSFSVNSMAGDYQGFSLEETDSEICKVVDTDGEKEKQCLPRFANFAKRFEVIERAEEVNDLMFEVAARRDDLPKDLLDTLVHATMPLETLIKIKKDYRRLSVRKLAIGLDQAQEEGGSLHIPLYFSVYWQGRAYTEGTVNVSAKIVAEKDNNWMHKLFSNNELFESVVLGSTGMAVDNFSDTTTSSGLDKFRLLEGAARGLHSIVANDISGPGWAINPDDFTLELIETAIGPALVGEVIYVPMLKRAISGGPDTEFSLSQLIHSFAVFSERP